MRSRLVAILGAASLLAMLIACSDNVPQNSPSLVSRTPQAVPTETMSVRPTRTPPPAGAAAPAPAVPPEAPRAGATPGAPPLQPGVPAPSSLAPATVGATPPPAAQQPLITPVTTSIVPVASTATPSPASVSAPPTVSPANPPPVQSVPGSPTPTPSLPAPTPTQGNVPAGATVAVQVANQTVTAGQSFEATIVANGVSNLGGFEFNLSYNPSVVSVQSVALGDFVRSSGRSFTPLGPTIDGGAGTANYAAFSMGNTPAGASGSGTLAIVTLRATAAGQSNLTVTAAKLIDPVSTAQTIGQLSGTSVVVQ